MHAYHNHFSTKSHSTPYTQLGEVKLIQEPVTKIKNPFQANLIKKSNYHHKPVQPNSNAKTS